VDPRVAGSNPDEAMDFFRAIKIRSTPEVPCHKILQHVKDPLRYLRN
jgi:hypothetical protein